MSSESRIPLLFKNIEGHEYQVGMVNLVDTAQGVVMIATIDHPQFRNLVSQNTIGAMSITFD